MKKVKINGDKIKKVLRGGIVLATASFALISFGGCSEQSVPRDYPREYEYINQEYNDFDSLYKTIVRDGKAAKAYNKENIFITVNKDTYEVKEYLYIETMMSAETYDLETGYLIVDSGLGEIDKKKKNLEIISNNAQIVNFVDLEAYVEGEPSQDFYTLEEIRKLEPKIVESVKLILDYENGNQKTK